MILLVFNRRSFVAIRFDLTSFADKMYQGREASERHNMDNAMTFTERSPAISKPIF
jgi:hypothetical protein